MHNGMPALPDSEMEDDREDGVRGAGDADNCGHEGMNYLLRLTRLNHMRVFSY